MNYRRRRQLIVVFGVLAAIAFSAKFFKAVWRGEITQSRVKPLN